MTKAIDDLAGLVRHTDPNESNTNGDAGEAGQTEKVPIIPQSGTRLRLHWSTEHEAAPIVGHRAFCVYAHE